jgi:hypothetical protein
MFIDKLLLGCQCGPGRFNCDCGFRICLTISWLLLATFPPAIAAAMRVFKPETAGLIGGASKVANGAVSGGYLIGLNKPGEGATFADLPAASKLVIRYASVEVGTISVAVTDQPTRKVNVHSSGALTNFFHNAIVDVAVPAGAMLTVRLATNGVAVNIDQITTIRLRRMLPVVKCDLGSTCA